MKKKSLRILILFIATMGIVYYLLWQYQILHLKRFLYNLKLENVLVSYENYTTDVWSLKPKLIITQPQFKIKNSFNLEFTDKLTVSKDIFSLSMIQLGNHGSINITLKENDDTYNYTLNTQVLLYFDRDEIHYLDIKTNAPLTITYKQQLLMKLHQIKMQFKQGQHLKLRLKELEIVEEDIISDHLYEILSAKISQIIGKPQKKDVIVKDLQQVFSTITSCEIDCNWKNKGNMISELNLSLFNYENPKINFSLDGNIVRLKQDFNLNINGDIKCNKDSIKQLWNILPQSYFLPELLFRYVIKPLGITSENWLKFINITPNWLHILPECNFLEDLKFSTTQHFHYLNNKLHEIDCSGFTLTNDNDKIIDLSFSFNPNCFACDLLEPSGLQLKAQIYDYQSNISHFINFLNRSMMGFCLVFNKKRCMLFDKSTNQKLVRFLQIVTGFTPKDKDLELKLYTTDDKVYINDNSYDIKEFMVGLLNSMPERYKYFG